MTVKVSNLKIIVLVTNEKLRVMVAWVLISVLVDQLSCTKIQTQASITVGFQLEEYKYSQELRSFPGARRLKPDAIPSLDS